MFQIHFSAFCVEHVFDIFGCLGSAPRYHDWFEVPFIGVSQGPFPTRHGPVEHWLLIMCWTADCIDCEFFKQLVACYLKNRATLYTAIHYYPTEEKARTKGGGRSIIRGKGYIFIYSCSQTVKTIEFERNDAQHEYMNMCPPPSF